MRTILGKKDVVNHSKYYPCILLKGLKNPRSSLGRIDNGMRRDSNQTLSHYNCSVKPMLFNDNFKCILSLPISTITAEICYSAITRIPLLRYLHIYVIWKIQSPLFTLTPFRLSWDTSVSGFTKAAFKILKLNSTLPNPLFKRVYPLCTGYTSYNKYFLHSASVCVHLAPVPIYIRPQKAG